MPPAHPQTTTRCTTTTCPEPYGSSVMPIRRAPLASTILAAPLLLCAAATAAPFQCPKTGGTFTFAQSANVNGLDQMTSSAVSTRNIAMNIFETLVTRSDTNQPI